MQTRSRANGTPAPKWTQTVVNNNVVNCGTFQTATVDYTGDGAASHKVRIPLMPAMFSITDVNGHHGSNNAHATDLFLVDQGNNEIVIVGNQVNGSNHGATPISTYLTSTYLDVGRLGGNGYDGYWWNLWGPSGPNNNGTTFHLVLYGSTGSTCGSGGGITSYSTTYMGDGNQTSRIIRTPFTPSMVEIQWTDNRFNTFRSGLVWRSADGTYELHLFGYGGSLSYDTSNSTGNCFHYPWACNVIVTNGVDVGKLQYEYGYQNEGNVSYALTAWGSGVACPPGEFSTGAGCAIPPSSGGGSSSIQLQLIDQEIQRFLSNTNNTINANVNCPSGIPWACNTVVAGSSTWAALAVIVIIVILGSAAIVRRIHKPGKKRGRGTGPYAV